MIPYPFFITKKTILVKDIIGNSNVDARTWFRATINPQGTEIITIVGMNPSKANYRTSDETVNKLLQFAKDLSEHANNNMDIKDVIITNIVPFYTSNSSKLKKKIKVASKEIGNENLDRLININIDRVIKAMNLSHYVVLGWGNCYIDELLHRNITSKILEFLKEMNKEFFVFDFENQKSILSSTGQPRHFGYTHLPKGITSVQIEPKFFLKV